MKHIISIFFLLLIAGLLIISCGKSNQYGNYNGVYNPNAAFFTKRSFRIDSSLKSNPAHGKPGHRCDLPEGAPLDQKQLNLTSKQQYSNLSSLLENGNSSQQNVINQNNSSNSPTALNPEHGLPGHRCDIAVGAPINAVSTSASTTSTTPSVTSSSSSNPPHGQPGHQCVVVENSPTTTLSPIVNRNKNNQPTSQAEKHTNNQDSLPILINKDSEQAQDSSDNHQ